MVQEVLQVEMDVFDETAAEADLLEDEVRSSPEECPALQQAQLASLQLALADIVLR
jgi:hypothetical protein